MPGVLITERLDTKTGQQILEKIDEAATAAAVQTEENLTQTQAAITAAQVVIQGFVDGVEPTQAEIQAAQAAMVAAQGALQDTHALLLTGQIATHAEIDEVQAAQVANKAEVLAADDASKTEVLAAQVTHKETLKDRMDVSLLLLANDEAVGVPNPVVLFSLPQSIYQCISPEPFHFAGGCVELYGGSWDKDEEVVISAESIVEGHWKEIYRHVIGKKTFIPLGGIVYLAGLDCAGGGVRVRMEQSEEGDGFHSWYHTFVK